MIVYPATPSLHGYPACAHRLSCLPVLYIYYYGENCEDCRGSAQLPKHLSWWCRWLSSVKLKIITRLRNRPISSETHRMVLRSEAANRLHSWCWCSQNSTESWPSLWGTDWPCFRARQPVGALRKLVIILRILPWSHQPVQSSTRKCVKNSFKMPHYIILHIRAM